MGIEHGDFVLEERDDGWAITGYTGDARDLAIPSVVDGAPVTLIAVRAFEGNRNLQSVEIPETVTFVGNYAFASCSALERVFHNGSTPALNLGTFWNCTALTDVRLPDALVTIGDGALRCCTALQSVDIPKSVTFLGDSVFRECSALQSLVLDGAIEHIERSAFRDCTALSHLAVNHTLGYLGVRAFQNCPALTSVTILGEPIDKTLAAFRNHSQTYLVADYAVERQLLSFEEAKKLLSASKFPPELLLAVRIAASHPDRLGELPSKLKPALILAEAGRTEELRVLEDAPGFLPPAHVQKCIEAAQESGHTATAAYLVDLAARRNATSTSSFDSMKL